MGEPIGRGIEHIKERIGANPELTRPIFKERKNRRATEAVRILRTMAVRTINVAVVAPQAVRSAKPHESLIVLHDVVDFALQQTFIRVQLGEADIFPLNHRQSNGMFFGVHA